MGLRQKTSIGYLDLSARYGQSQAGHAVPVFLLPLLARTACHMTPLLIHCCFAAVQHRDTFLREEPLELSPILQRRKMRVHKGTQLT